MTTPIEVLDEIVLCLLKDFCENAEDEENPVRKVKLQLWDTAGQERWVVLCNTLFNTRHVYTIHCVILCLILSMCT